MKRRQPVMMLGIPLRKNPPDDVVETKDLIDVAKDMIKTGDLKGAAFLLADEANMSERNIAQVFFGAVVDELASGKRSAARKLFAPIRKMYREYELPSSLHSFVTFNATNAAIDFAIAESEDQSDIADRIEEADLYDVKTFGVEFANRDYRIANSEEDAEEIAIADVKERLGEEPDMFNLDFLNRFWDQDELKKQVRAIALDEDYWNEADDRDVMRAADQYRIDYEEDEDGDLVDGDRVRSDVAEAQAEERANDPMDYLQEILGDEMIPWLRDNVGIDIDAAAEAAVREDGAGVFLSSYDGNLNTTVSGFCYWRTN